MAQHRLDEGGRADIAQDSVTSGTAGERDQRDQQDDQ
jgi:hypothetical protein